MNFQKSLQIFFDERDFNAIFQPKIFLDSIQNNCCGQSKRKMIEKDEDRDDDYSIDLTINKLNKSVNIQFTIKLLLVKDTIDVIYN